MVGRPRSEIRRVTARAAARVDFAGGSLDLWPIGLIVGASSTVNVAISLAATVELTRTRERGLRLVSEELRADYRWRPGSPPGPLPLVERLCGACGVIGGWRVETRSDVPPGSGLGGSSAMSVALLLALNAAVGREMADAAVVAFCRDLEAANLRIPTGVQDFWPALRGGVLSIRYEPGGEVIERLSVPMKALASRLLVVYSGQSRLSASTNWNLTKRFLDGDPETFRHLKGIAEIAARVKKCLEAGDINGVGPLMDEEWNHRRQLADGISTVAIEEMLSRARKAGALGGKACGAGGGGSLAFVVPEGARLEVEQALEREGARILAAHPVERGHSLEIDP